MYPVPSITAANDEANRRHAKRRAAYREAIAEILTATGDAVSLEPDAGERIVFRVSVPSGMGLFAAVRIVMAYNDARREHEAARAEQAAGLEKKPAKTGQKQRG